MARPKLNLKKLRLKQFRLAILATLGLLVLLLIFFAGYSISFAHKILRNQSVGAVDVSGMSQEAAKTVLSDRTKTILAQGVILEYVKAGEPEKTYTIKPEDIALQYDIDSSMNRAWQYGRGRNVFLSLFQQLSSLFVRHTVPFAYSYNIEGLNKQVSGIAAELDDPEKDFSLDFQDGHFVLLTDRKAGSRIDQEEIKQNILDRMAKEGLDKISFQAKEYSPQVDENKAKKRLADANAIIDAGPLSLVYGTQKFTIDTATIGAFIKSKTNGDDLEIVFNDERLGLHIISLAKSIDVTPQNAGLKIENGRAVVFQTARIGQALDQTQTKIDIENALLARMPDNQAKADPVSVSLKVATTRPEITDDAVTKMGIVELVGTGTTDYKKSPANRVHNIQTGAAAITGALIKPGETFSTLAKLGAIDASTGYLPELVIKEDRTTPEFGGGLCQVSTTLFRAALNAGLKITERYNHSYRVSYYEPPVGMDATIYDPAPDFKFVNNYASYLLVQATITGTKITFDIYGTKDGRVATVSTPEMYDIVPPGAPVMVETDTLPAGEKKQIEKAHDGASAKFYYKVVRGSETLQEKTFVSKYVPWPEKWLVGKGTPPATTSCTDGIQNGDETGIDCGGSCPTACPVI